MTKPDLIFVAQVSAANGLQGEFKLLSFMDDPLSVLEYNPLLNEKGEPALVITKAREHKGTLIVKAEGVPDRTAADKIKGLKLYIDRAELPEAEEGEYYISDLIGMKAFDAAGNEVGRVMNVDNFGHCGESAWVIIVNNRLVHIAHEQDIGGSAGDCCHVVRQALPVLLERCDIDLLQRDERKEDHNRVACPTQRARPQGQLAA
jgi:16S rRNA processing protein RimM